MQRTIQNRCLRQLNYFCESERERRRTGGLQLPNARAARTGAEDASNPEAHIEQIIGVAILAFSPFGCRSYLRSVRGQRLADLQMAALESIRAAI
jgi:hypothetical protein